LVRRRPSASPAEAFFLRDRPEYAAYQIGEWSMGWPTVLYGESGAQLKVGRFCSFARNVTIFLGGEHRVDWVTTYGFTDIIDDLKGFPGHPRTKGDVVIGHDVWLARGAVILSGVKIGNGAVIGTHSVVASDVPAYGIAVGNPARVIRLRFTEGQIEALQRIAWWDWPIEQITQAAPLLLNDNIDAFIAAYDKPASGAAHRKEPLA
jgi:acetyltransferase-like isoleucine patch superfamily enzyme